MTLTAVQEDRSGNCVAVEVDGQWHTLPPELRIPQVALLALGMELGPDGSIVILGQPKAVQKTPETAKDKVAKWDPTRVGTPPEIGVAVAEEPLPVEPPVKLTAVGTAQPAPARSLFARIKAVFTG